MHPVTSKIAPTPNANVLAAPETSAEFRRTAVFKSIAPHFDALFAGYQHVVLAVSGGADSTALMHAAVAWRHRRLSVTPDSPAPTLSIVTINHRLRPEATDEAESVAAAARQLGLAHTTLTWDGTKPSSGLQAAAREARHALIRQHLRSNGWPAVALAHTQDDQAETLLMRLARGTGIDGLGAMRSRSDLGGGLTVLRPLLDIPKAALTELLTAHGITWIEDPSNHSPAFERVRLRQTQAKLQALSLGLDTAALSRTATRAQRASNALWVQTASAWAGRGNHARFDPLGFAVVDWPWLRDAPEEIRLRLLATLIETVGGQPGPVSLGRLEAMTCARDWLPPDGLTLHGVVFGSDCHAMITLTREFGRLPLPELNLAPGTSAVWDRRFRVASETYHSAPLRFGALGPDGLAEIEAAGWHRPEIAARVLWTQPAVRSATASTPTVLAAPTLGYRPAGAAISCQCEPVLPRFALLTYKT